MPVERNSSSGIIGCRPRAWIKRKAARLTPASTKLPITGTVPKPSVPPVMSPYINAAKATIAAAWPAQSNGVGRRGDLATAARSMSIAMQTGRLIPNTSRQSSVVRRPPTSGPTAPATAPPTAQIPRACARRRGSGKACRISAIDAGSMIDAAPPWRKRAAMSTPDVGASAHATDATRKRAIPHPSALFAPIRSDRFPANSNNAANISV